MHVIGCIAGEIGKHHLRTLCPQRLGRCRSRGNTNRASVRHSGGTHIPGMIADVGDRRVLEQHLRLLLGKGLTDDDIRVEPRDIEHPLGDGAVLGRDHQDARSPISQSLNDLDGSRHRDRQRDPVLGVVLAVGGQQHVIGLIGQPGGKHPIQRQPDRRGNVSRGNRHPVGRAHMLHRGDDPSG